MVHELEKVFLFGQFSYGVSQLLIGTDADEVVSESVLDDQAILIHNKDSQVIRLTNISLAVLKNRPPRFLNIPTTTWKRIFVLGESSFDDAQTINSVHWNDLGIPNVLPDQIAFVADERFYITAKRHILFLQI